MDAAGIGCDDHLYPKGFGNLNDLRVIAAVRKRQPTIFDTQIVFERLLRRRHIRPRRFSGNCCQLRMRRRMARNRHRAAFRHVPQLVPRHAPRFPDIARNDEDRPRIAVLFHERIDHRVIVRVPVIKRDANRLFRKRRALRHIRVKLGHRDGMETVLSNELQLRAEIFFRQYGAVIRNVADHVIHQDGNAFRRLRFDVAPTDGDRFPRRRFFGNNRRHRAHIRRLLLRAASRHAQNANRRCRADEKIFPCRTKFPKHAAIAPYNKKHSYYFTTSHQTDANKRIHNPGAGSAFFALDVS